jgi:hypothetical protein
VDADDQLWDHTVAYPKLGEGARNPRTEEGYSAIESLRTLVGDIEAELGRGENIMLNHQLLNETERGLLLRLIDERRIPRARIRFIPPL